MNTWHFLKQEGLVDLGGDTASMSFVGDRANNEQNEQDVEMDDTKLEPKYEEQLKSEP